MTNYDLMVEMLQKSLYPCHEPSEVEQLIVCEGVREGVTKEMTFEVGPNVKQKFAQGMKVEGRVIRSHEVMKGPCNRWFWWINSALQETQLFVCICVYV